MRPMRFVTIATLSCLAASVAVAQNTGIQPAATQRGRPVIDLDAHFASIVPTGPGCAVGAKIAAAAPLIRTFGLADLEHPTPIVANSVFESGSLAKQFTAAAMLLLVQDGKLALDNDIRRYLPEMPDYGTPITIRHLLTHTSGLREQWSLLALSGNPPGSQVHTQGTILDLASRQKGLNFAPGAEFLYTNTNYALASMIIERVSGTSLQHFTDRRLFQPLGMAHSRWRADFRTIVPGRAMAYAATPDGFLANMPFTNVYGNGGLLTTIGDLLSWNAFLDDPSALPGGAALVAALQTPGKLRSGFKLEYALGLEVTRARGLRLISHSGSTGGYKTWLGRYPDRGVSVAVLCNNGGIDPVAIGENIAKEALESIGYTEFVAPPPSPAAQPRETVCSNLPQYEGLFRNLVTGELVETKVINGRLTLRQGQTKVLVHINGGHFVGEDGDRLLFSTAKGRPDELMLVHGERTQRFVAVARPGTNGEALIAYVGTYYSAELDTRIAVVRQGDRLVLRQPFAVEWLLTPSFADGFTTPLRGTTTFVFSRKGNGHINGFAAWANGARNVQFVRLPR